MSDNQFVVQVERELEFTPLGEDQKEKRPQRRNDYFLLGWGIRWKNLLEGAFPYTCYSTFSRHTRSRERK